MKTPKSKKKLIASIFVISLILIPIITVQVKTKDELIYLRAQLIAARFLANSDDLVNIIAQIFNTRISNGQAI